MKHFLLLIVLLKLCSESFAQDFQLTQFYASPVYLNPAFAGSSGCSRFVSNYRRQWASIPGSFSSGLLSAEHHISAINSGIGLLITSDRHGAGKFTTTGYNLVLGNQVKLSREWTLGFGFQGGYVTNFVSLQDFTFTDQLITGSNTSMEAAPTERMNYADFSSGLLLFSKNIWAGFSAHHLNWPSNGVINHSGILPPKISLHGGFVIPIGEKYNDRSLTPVINYKGQGKFDQLDLGLYHKHQSFVIGCWYRGIPMVKRYSNFINHDTFAFIIGAKKDKFSIGYSYDLTISKLTPRAGGSHEISLVFNYCKSKKIKRFMPCPEF